MSSDISGKVYVGGLNFNTSTDALKAHFEQYGKISDCIVMTDRETGRSRGFGFITFEDPGSANAAIAMPSQSLDGRTVSVKKAVRDAPPAGAGMGAGGAGMGSSSGDTGAQDSSSGEYNAVKIFVGGLPPSVDYDKLTAYFSKFGTIEDAVVMMDASTQRSRGFGFVTFSNNSAVEAVMAVYKTNEIEGKWVEVKRCIPQDKMAPGQSSKGKGKGGRGSPTTSGGMMPGGMPEMQPCPAVASTAPGGFPGAYGVYPGAYAYAQPGAYGAYAGCGCGYPGAYGTPTAYGYPGYAYPPGYGAAPAYGGCAPGAFPGYGAMAPAAALPPADPCAAQQRAAPY
eukprot:TRINITY_DN62178_c0_g1_i1.p2 TRINITY_DN62178_c0_g1~~TRINITY_DN62178_c0_g1_i1.p2  ORF type:complete len:348 (-),score=59.48 TRINITY_DN62178_c0_g1_i1:49-1065(-)